MCAVQGLADASETRLDKNKHSVFDTQNCNKLLRISCGLCGVDAGSLPLSSCCRRVVIIQLSYCYHRVDFIQISQFIGQRNIYDWSFNDFVYALKKKRKQSSVFVPEQFTVLR